MEDICTVTIESIEKIDARRIEAPYKYGYAYTVSIHNLSASSMIQILSRRWIIRDGDMRDRIVEGPGVVGYQPILKPGQSFEYTSYTMLQSRYGSMLGTYYGTITPDYDEDEEYPQDGSLIISGEAFEVPIPEFNLIHASTT